MAERKFGTWSLEEGHARREDGVHAWLYLHYSEPRWLALVRSECSYQRQAEAIPQADERDDAIDQWRDTNERQQRCNRNLQRVTLQWEGLRHWKVNIVWSYWRYVPSRLLVQQYDAWNHHWDMPDFIRHLGEGVLPRQEIRQVFRHHANDDFQRLLR